MHCTVYRRSLACAALHSPAYLCTCSHPITTEGPSCRGGTLEPWSMCVCTWMRACSLVAPLPIKKEKKSEE